MTILHYDEVHEPKPSCWEMEGDLHRSVDGCSAPSVCEDVPPEAANWIEADTDRGAAAKSASVRPPARIVWSLQEGCEVQHHLHHITAALHN